MSLNTQTNPKLIGLNAVMNNPNLSRVVSDALNSPPGSLKREKASAMLRSLNKASSRLDGQGGGNPYMDMDLNQQWTTPQISNSTPSTIGIPSPQQSPQQSTTPQPTTTTGQPTSATAEQAPNIGAEEVEQPQKFLWPAEEGVIEPEPQSQLPPGFEAGQNTDYYDNAYNNLSPEDKIRFKPLYEARKAQVGPESFALSVQADAEKLHGFMPNVPMDMLPVGASLTRQTAEVEDALREKYKVEEMENNLDRLKETGLTIEDNLADYMTARDKYIERLDSLIDTTNESMIDMDMANPYINKQMNNYRNYLYIMKGRQQKRYADFLKTAINQHNLELTRAQNAYDSTLKQFNRELDSKTAITEEDYNNINEMLKEMYNTLDKREEKEARMGILNEQLLKAQFDNIDTSLRAYENNTMTKADTEKSKNNYLIANKDATEADWKALSVEDKRRWTLKKDDVVDYSMLNFYLNQVGSGDRGTEFVDEEGNILWKSIPSQYWDIIIQTIADALAEAELEAAGQSDTGTWGAIKNIF